MYDIIILVVTKLIFWSMGKKEKKKKSLSVDKIKILFDS